MNCGGLVEDSVQLFFSLFPYQLSTLDTINHHKIKILRTFFTIN
jgi:hypothetical protein